RITTAPLAVQVSNLPPRDHALGVAGNGYTFNRASGIGGIPETRDLFARLQVPLPDVGNRSSGRRGNYLAAILRESNAGQPSGCSIQDAIQPAAADVPHFHDALVAARQNKPAVGGKHHALDRFAIALVTVHLLAVLDVPEANGPVLAPGNG